jgi:hypothetical protein
MHFDVRPVTSGRVLATAFFGFGKIVIERYLEIAFGNAASVVSSNSKRLLFTDRKHRQLQHLLAT